MNKNVTFPFLFQIKPVNFNPNPRHVKTCRFVTIVPIKDFRDGFFIQQHLVLKLVKIFMLLTVMFIYSTKEVLQIV